MALGAFALLPCIGWSDNHQATGLWLFDEPRALYPSSVLDSSSEHDYPLVLGRGGQLVQGKFGNALMAGDSEAIELPEGPLAMGLGQVVQGSPPQTTRLTWRNARYAAVMTNGARHLRKEIGMVNASKTGLNLGRQDWTVEFWWKPHLDGLHEASGVVFEIGSGPLLRSSVKTQLIYDGRRDSFRWVCGPGATEVVIPTQAVAAGGPSRWRHFAFTYEAETGQVRHFVDGALQSLPEPVELTPVEPSEEAYFSLCRTGAGTHPLPGPIDELRFSRGVVYRESFEPPGSFAAMRPKFELPAGPPLLWGEEASDAAVIELGDRKHLFIDDALLESLGGAKLKVNPPRKCERVLGALEGPFRKHLTVVEDAEGVIRIYHGAKNDALAVTVSRDGVHFAPPELPTPAAARVDVNSHSRVVLHDMVGGLGSPFRDDQAPPAERWKYFTDYHRRGIYLYTSADGYQWKRHKTATLPFRSGTQSCTFYDDQRQLYLAYHRSGIYHTPAGGTERSSVRTEHRDLAAPVEFTPVSASEYLARQEPERLRNPLPWFLDNGPLTPGGFGLEFPHAFRPAADDLPGTDIYVTKAQKYLWAPDTYLAFPIIYFHYQPDGPVARNALASRERGRGSGPLETQLSVSRDGCQWRRYPRPAYVGIGPHAGRDVRTAYLAHGMIRRGDEIWQYYFGETQYHSAHRFDRPGRGVYRLVQRLDGFVSVDSPYDREVTMVTRPLKFSGNRLSLNVDTDAAGYLQVGVRDAAGRPIPGFTVDDCIYVNGDHVAVNVRWLDAGEDVSRLAGQTVRLAFRMRGSKLYAMQFRK